MVLLERSKIAKNNAFNYNLKTLFTSHYEHFSMKYMKIRISNEFLKKIELKLYWLKNLIYGNNNKLKSS